MPGAVPIAVRNLDPSVERAQAKPGKTPWFVKTKCQPGIPLVPGRTPDITVFGIPVTMRQFPACLEIIDEPVVVTAKLQGVPDITVVGVVFR